MHVHNPDTQIFKLP